MCSTPALVDASLRLLSILLEAGEFPGVCRYNTKCQSTYTPNIMQYTENSYTWSQACFFLRFILQFESHNILFIKTKNNQGWPSLVFKGSLEKTCDMFINVLGIKIGQNTILTIYRFNFQLVLMFMFNLLH